MNQQYPAAGLASLVAAQGRGQDSTLVHMTPDEVRNLQDIARARGIEMPINPATGLPEAGWLSDFLGSVAKGVRNIGTAAIQNPQITSALIGTAYGAVKGDLQKGIEAGMAAYAGTKLLGSIPSVARAVDDKTAEDARRYAAEQGGSKDEQAKNAAEYIKRSSGLGALGAPRTVTQQPQAGQAAPQQRGLFRSGDPIMDAIALYGVQRLEQKLTGQKRGIPAAQPQQFRNVQFSRGQVNPRFGEPGQPYFIGGGYADQGITTQYPGYTQAPTTPQPQGPVQGQQPMPPPNRPPGQQPPANPYYQEPQRYGLNLASGGIASPTRYAEGGEVETEEERRRKYFENLRPFAPALSDFYRSGTTGVGSDQGVAPANVDPMTRLPQPAPSSRLPT